MKKREQKLSQGAIDILKSAAAVTGYTVTKAEAISAQALKRRGYLRLEPIIALTGDRRNRRDGYMAFVTAAGAAAVEALAKS